MCIRDSTYVGENENVLNLTYRQNDLGYVVGTFAGLMTCLLYTSWECSSAPSS